MSSGIYKIENIKNGKIYVGSAVDLKKRFRSHLNEMVRNNHKNQHLQNVYNKYGKDIFEFSVIEYVENKENLLEREQYYIDRYDFDFIYNINPTAGSCLGRKHSDDTKRKISISNMGNKPTNAFRKGHTVNVGRKVSKETKEKIRVANTGKKHSVYTRKKMSESRIGKRHSEETRKRMSKAHVGKVVSEETRKKLSIINTGESNPNYGTSKEIRVINGKEHFECCRCKKYLLRGLFHKCSTIIHGIYPSCKKCRSVYRKKRYKESVLKQNNVN